MKKILYILIPVMAVLTFNSCMKQLDIEQKGALEQESFYANASDDDALSLIAAIYKNYNTGVRSYPYHIVLSGLGQDVYKSSAFSDMPAYGEVMYLYGSSSNSTLKSIYTNLYKVIYYCNLIIEKLPADSDIKNTIIAEARFIRAICHLDLVRYWGTPVLVDHLFSADELKSAGNTPSETTWEWIENELKDVVAGGKLPVKSGKNGQAAIGGRISHHTALSYLGKVQLYRGKKTEAAATLKLVVNSNLYDLVDWDLVCTKEGDFCEEYVWEFNASNTNQTNYTAQGDARWIWWGWRSDQINPVPSGVAWETYGFGSCVTKDFATFLLAHDGQKGKRWYHSVWDMEDVCQKSNITVTAGQLPAGQDLIKADVQDCEGYMRVRKYIFDDDMFDYPVAYRARAKTNDYIMRYSEVLLLYAEATLDTQEGLAAFNKVRERSELAAVGSYTLQDIKDERRAELFFEGERFYDLIRWGDVATALQDQGKVQYYFTLTQPTGGETYTAGPGGIGYVVAVPQAGRNGWSDKYRLFPFPDTEVTALSPNLKQNPEW